MYTQETNSKERRKVVIIAVATVALIVALIVAIVAVAASKANRPNVGGTDNSSFTIEKVAKSEDTKTATPKVDTVSTKTSTSSSAKTTSTAPVASDIPSTGPEDLLPLAGALGMLTTAGTAYAMKKRA